VTVPPEL